MVLNLDYKLEQKCLREELLEAKNSLLETVKSSGLIVGARVEGNRRETPQLKLNYDKKKIYSLGLSYEDIDNTLSSAWAGNYVNDFIDRSRVKRVYTQADAQYRAKPEDLYLWNVRNKENKWSLLKSLLKYLGNQLKNH